MRSRHLVPQATRGIALIEALIALAIVAVAMLAAMQFQQKSRVLGDVSRERAEATRLADAELERLRRFGSAAEFAAFGDGAETRVGTASTARFDASRQTSASAGALDGVSEAVARIDWSDRTGTAHRVEMATLIAGHDPRLSAALTTTASDAAPRAALARHPSIPLTARDLGNGRSTHTPAGGGTTSWVFDNATGLVTSRCSGPAATGCAAVHAVAVMGTIRFDASATPNPAAANDAPLPLAIVIAGSELPASCTHGIVASGGERFARYECIVEMGTAPSWSGRIEIAPTGWTIGTGSADRRVCRYAAVAQDRVAHAAVSITHQDFLVVRGDIACPGAAAVILDPVPNGTYVDRTTVAHQP